jgi:hypothetical protein
MLAKTDLKFLYTSIEPFVSQLNPSQSIGGYPSDTTYSASSTLSSTLSVSGLSVTTQAALGGSRLLIDDEIIEVQGTGATRAVLNRGALSTTARPHVSGSPVFSIPAQSLFNNALSDARVQYRCLAVKNVNPTLTFSNLTFFFKEQSVTPFTTVKMAVEVPRTEYYLGSASSGSLISLVDHGLTSFADNWFAGCVVKVLSGPNVNARRTVLSFDRATTTLVLDSALPFAVGAGVSYEIQPAPAQTIASGTVAPTFSTARVSGLVPAAARQSALGINVTGTRINGSHLAPNEVIYLWLARSRSDNAPAQLNNRVIFTANYDKPA